ncbi:MAG: RagB/SusD family nutrient uptake outer membrane protein [Bacteroidota bacterium]
MKKNVFLLAFIFSFFLLVSCSDDAFELDQPPEPPWTTLNEFERVPIGLYHSMYSGNHWKIAYSNYAMFKVSGGDDIAYVSDPSWGYLRDSKQNNIWSDANFQLLYRTIGTANDAIAFVAENNGDPYPLISDDDRVNNFNRILGEIYFARGMAYYYLQTFYGHPYNPNGANNDAILPYRVKFANNVEEATNPEIGTTQQIFDLMLSDFERAYSLLPERFDSGKHHPSFEVRGNKFAAASMLMKIHFSRGEYDEALALTDFIIDENKGAYNLSEDPIEAFNKGGTARGREVIFYIPYSDPSFQGPHHLSVLNNTYENGRLCEWAETRMSKTLLDKLGWIDDLSTTQFNDAALRDKRFQQVMEYRNPSGVTPNRDGRDPRREISGETTVWPFKYFRNGDSFYTNVPLVRLAEIYLTRSILRFKSGNIGGAAEDLEMVRRRAWDESVMPYEPISSGQLTEDDIHTERMVEMFNEPDRIEYLRALKMDIPPGDREAASPEPYTSEKFIWAIPVAESSFNNNID